jgi:hypothetical protein
MCYTLDIIKSDYIVQVSTILYTLYWNEDKLVNMKTLDNPKITRNIDSAMFVHKIR